MKTPDSPLPPISSGWDAAVENMQHVAVEHWWIFLVAAAIIIIFMAPKK